MVKLTHRFLAILLVVAAVLGLAACGGSSGSDTSAEVVGTVGTTAITKPQLNHWMSTLLGGDYYELTAATVPAGVVAEPPRLAACERNLATITPHFTSAEVKVRCQQLARLLREQAMTYLIDSDVYVGEVAELGAKVTSSEVVAAFNVLRKEHFPTESELQEYLAQRHWSLSDELFLVKRDLLGTKLLQQVHAKLGKSASEAAVDQYYKELGNKWIAKTSCKPGYVVQGCKQYREPKTPPKLSPAIEIEEIRSQG